MFHFLQEATSMEVLENESRTRILKEFEIVRSTTMNLVKTLEADDYPVQTAPYTSPPKWHIGHTSWIYETVMSKINTEYEFYSKEYSKYLNSYYQQFGMPHDKSKRGIISRPTTKQIFEYAEIVNGRVENLSHHVACDATAFNTDCFLSIHLPGFRRFVFLYWVVFVCKHVL